MMKVIYGLFGGLMTWALVPGCGPAHKPEMSQTDSVEIPQTPVENQFQIGFCWAYATIGLIESDYKVRTGQELQLSEEALGYYRMLEGLYYLSQNLPAQEILSALLDDTFQGWVLKSDEVPDSFDLVRTYGIVPESAWSPKFKDPDRVERMVRAIRRSMAELVYASSNPRAISRAQIEKLVLLAKGGWESAPPQEFAVDGEVHTPLSYLRAVGFQPDQFESVVTSRPSDVNRVIAAAKRALVRGYSVPLGFPVNFDRLDADTFSGKEVDLLNGDNFFRDGGHAVLVDDFVNLGGRQGALPLQDLQQEFLRPASELAYLVFKNSWGIDAETNESGSLISGSSDGYYKMDKEYLVGSANLAVRPEFEGILEVVVPKDIAEDPFGYEAVNPAVALPAD
jgi:hypothetical protein